MSGMHPKSVVFVMLQDFVEVVVFVFVGGSFALHCAIDLQGCCGIDPAVRPWPSRPFRPHPHHLDLLLFL